MFGAIARALEDTPPLAYAAGHEHGLQVLDGGALAGYSLVSGAGAGRDLTSLTHGDETLLPIARSVLMLLDFVNDGRVRLSVIEPAQTNPLGAEVFSLWLETTRKLPGNR